MDGESTARGTNDRKRGLPSGLLGMITLVALIEAGIAGRDAFTTTDAATWRFKGEAAGREAVACDVLCFGDSLIEFGVLPRVFEERAGLRAFNLSLRGGSPESSYFQLGRTLNAGARPRAIVVDFMPYQVADLPRLDGLRRRLWPELMDPAAVIDVAWARRDPGLAATLGLAVLLPSYRSRLEIRDSILALLTRRGIEDEMDHLRLIRANLERNRGAFVWPDGGRTGPSADALNPDLTADRDPKRVVFLDRFLRLAARRKIRVYWLVPPISPEFQAVCDATGSNARFDELFRAKEAEHPNLVLVDGRHAGYDPTLFMDGMHLNRRGATAMSLDLADLISPPPGPNRRFSLIGYRDQPRSPSVEDVGESLAILGIKAPRRHR